MISILLPTRGRPERCRRTVRLLRDLAARPGEIEILIRHDHDDPAPPLSAQDTSLLEAVKVYAGPRHGYAGAHHYYNELAAAARGDWLFVWNDDTEILTPGWDAKLCEAPPFCVQWPRRNTTATTDFTFPVIGRPVYERVPQTTSIADAWWLDVSFFANLAVVRDDIVFFHHRLDDQTMREATRDTPAEWARFQQEQVGSERRAAVEALRTAPAWPDRFAGWITEETHRGGEMTLPSGAVIRNSTFVLKGRLP